MSCNPVASSASALSTPINLPMSDNGDGTYSYTLNLNSPGNITISVVLIREVNIEGVFYDNISFSGPTAAVNYTK